jgi:membrane protein YqaA with SNARE-associated domain
MDPLSVMPIQHFPAELFEFQPDVVILTMAMPWMRMRPWRLLQVEQAASFS